MGGLKESELQGLLGSTADNRLRTSQLGRKSRAVKTPRSYDAGCGLVQAGHDSGSERVHISCLVPSCRRAMFVLLISQVCAPPRDLRLGTSSGVIRFLRCRVVRRRGVHSFHGRKYRDEAFVGGLPESWLDHWTYDCLATERDSLPTCCCTGFQDAIRLEATRQETLKQ